MKTVTDFKPLNILCTEIERIENLSFKLILLIPTSKYVRVEYDFYVT